MNESVAVETNTAETELEMVQFGNAVSIHNPDRMDSEFILSSLTVEASQ